MKKLFVFFLLLAWIPAFAGMTMAADAPPVTFLAPETLASHQKTIDRVQEYLSGLTTVVADFTQTAPDGTLSGGKFYLQRPGKMRWQYQPPTPILIVADGHEMVFYDYELEQVTHIPLDSTLIGFLAEKQIRFSDSVGITAISDKADVIRITVAQRKKPKDGMLTLEFSDAPLALRNMIITDATGAVTTVSLDNAMFGTPLDKQLFIFTDPRKAGIQH